MLAGVKSGKQLIEAALDMDPDTLNLDSQGNWVTAYIELPQGFDVSEVDPATIMLNQASYADRVEVVINVINGDHAETSQNRCPRSVASHYRAWDRSSKDFLR